MKKKLLYICEKERFEEKNLNGHKVEDIINTLMKSRYESVKIGFENIFPVWANKQKDFSNTNDQLLSLPDFVLNLGNGKLRSMFLEVKSINCGNPKNVLLPKEKIDIQRKFFPNTIVVIAINFKEPLYAIPIYDINPDLNSSVRTTRLNDGKLYYIADLTAFPFLKWFRKFEGTADYYNAKKRILAHFDNINGKHNQTNMLDFTDNF